MIRVGVVYMSVSWIASDQTSHKGKHPQYLQNFCLRRWTKVLKVATNLLNKEFHIEQCTTLPIRVYIIQTITKDLVLIGNWYYI